MKAVNEGKSAKELQALLLAEGIEQKVEVNQRHLIDKILARYSGEFTLFRELIQNANDAEAKELEVILRSPSYVLTSTATPNPSINTSPATPPASSAQSAASSIFNIFRLGRSKPAQAPAPSGANESSSSSSSSYHSASRPCNSALIEEIEVRNNGRAFGPEDWSRVMKIAEGNPNQHTCGMFGVGFYSVFSLAENPIIRSGRECLLFHWKQDQLLTSRATLPQEEGQEKSPWTSIVLQCREQVPFELESLSQFLVKSVAFTSHLRCVRLFVNDHKIIEVNMRVVPELSSAIPVPPLTSSHLAALYKKNLSGYMSICK
jgi:hypothetical protein